MTFFASLIPAVRWTESIHEAALSQGASAVFRPYLSADSSLNFNDDKFNETELEGSSPLKNETTIYFNGDKFNETELEGSFSACLMVMDDNHRLIEWIAYHYHVLRLRYLILAVDPRSKTSPWGVLRKWEPLVKIIVWEDRKFMPQRHLRKLSDNSSVKEKWRLHGRRQGYFTSACSYAMRKTKRTYVLLVDPDEYILFDDPNKTHEIINSTRRVSIAEKGAILNVLEEARELVPGSEYAAPCMPIPRRLFGAQESAEDERQRNVPSGYNATHFDTLRYRFRSNDTQLGKNIIDVSRIDPKDLKNVWEYFNGPHNVLTDPRRYCFNVHYLHFHVNIFRVNHYLGSWQSYSFRNDARNSNSWRGKQVRDDYPDCSVFLTSDLMDSSSLSTP